MLSRTHPKQRCISPGRKPVGYSLPMEVLCTVPLAIPANVKSLANDFATTQMDMRAMLGLLARKHGILADGQTAVVPLGKREQVESECLEYWHNVYGF